MKKILSIFAAAVIALSFASCEKNEQVGSKFFKINVTNITADGATVSVTPADTATGYFWYVVSQATLDQNEMTIEEWAADDMDYYANYYTYDELAAFGPDEYDFEGEFTAATVYYAYAFHFDEEFNILGTVAYKKFTTKHVAVEETVKVTGEGVIYDLTEEIGLFQVMADIDAVAGSYFFVTLIAESAEGKFTQEDIDNYYGAYVIIDEATDEYYPVAELSVKGAYLANGDYTFKGNVIAANGVKYVVDITCPAEEEGGAPARKFVQSKNVNDKKTTLKKKIRK